MHKRREGEGRGGSRKEIDEKLEFDFVDLIFIYQPCNISISMLFTYVLTARKSKEVQREEKEGKERKGKKEGSRWGRR